MGIRTPVSGLKTRRPRPLDDGDLEGENIWDRPLESKGGDPLKFVDTIPKRITW